MNSNPQKAYNMLKGIESDMQDASEATRMRYLLTMTRAQVKAQLPLSSDSIGEQLVSYFRRNGSANDRLASYYLLGHSFFDMGETPKACRHIMMR